MSRLVAALVLALLASTVPGAALADPAAPVVAVRAVEPLDGRIVVIDPGHQLGNHNFPEQIGRQVPAGGFTKPCNTTGTATDGGYPGPPSPGRSPAPWPHGSAGSAPPWC